MLNSMRNSKTMGQRVLAAARRSLKTERPRSLIAEFNHQQWWIHNLKTGATWSVVDAHGSDSVDGFDFEQVVEGDDAR